MKRIFNKNTKEEYTIGQPVTLSYKDAKGNLISFNTNFLTEDWVAHLVGLGVLVLGDAHEQHKKEEAAVNYDLGFYIEKIGKKCGMERDAAIDLFNALYNLNPVSAFSLLLKQIAFELDKKYPDHIRDSKRIFSVSTTNGTIIEIPVKTIKSYRNFAAFRSVEDARVACKICRGMLKDMFKNG